MVETVAELSSYRSSFFFHWMENIIFSKQPILKKKMTFVIKYSYSKMSAFNFFYIIEIYVSYSFIYLKILLFRYKCLPLS